MQSSQYKSLRLIAGLVILLAALFLASGARCQALEWNANAAADNVQNYRLYWGAASGDRQFYLNVGKATAYVFAKPFTTDTYFVVTAINAYGESGYSNEAIYHVAVIPPPDSTNVCDCNRDGKVDALDFAQLRRLIGTNQTFSTGQTNPKYNENFDINKDKKIDALDRAIFKRRCQ